MPEEPPQEVTLDSRTVYDGKIVRVRVDDVRLTSGRTSKREIVEHRGAVAIVAVTSDDHLLLIRQYRHAAGRVLLEIPAGTRELGETAEDTARRELVEETGYAPGSLIEVVTFFPTPGYSAEQITLFRADGCFDVSDEGDAEEEIAVVRVPLAEVPGLITPGADRVVDGKSLIGLLWLLRESDGSGR
jgi:ADP-ribose pyrophosphatase